MPHPLALGFPHPICDADVRHGVTRFVFLAEFQGRCWELVCDDVLLESHHWQSCQDTWPHEKTLSIQEFEHLSLLASVQNIDLSFSMPAFSRFQLYFFIQASPMFKIFFPFSFRFLLKNILVCELEFSFSSNVLMGALVLFTIHFPSLKLWIMPGTSVFPGFVAHKIQVQIDIVSDDVEIIQIYEPRCKILLGRKAQCY